jgi:formylglycine-generating enzyme required for sulfatase activity
MTQAFDPYYKWLGIAPKDQPPNHYRLLSIDQFEDDPDTISNAADRQMAHLRTFQVGPESKASQKLLNECSAARVCLLNAEKKSAYDAQLRSQLAQEHPALGAAARTAAPPQVLAAQPRPIVPTAIATVPPADPALVLSSRASGVHRPRRNRRAPPLVAVLLCSVGLATAYWLAKTLMIAVAPERAEQPAPTAASSKRLALGGASQTVQSIPSRAPPVPPAAKSPPQPPPLARAPFSGEEARRLQENWAEYLDQNVEEANSIGMKLVLIPPGEFDAGTPQEERDRLTAELVNPNSPAFINDSLKGEKQRHVTIADAYLLSAQEVSVGDFRKFVQATGYKTLAETEGGAGGWGEDGQPIWYAAEFSWQNIGPQKISDDLPVVNVALADAEEFCGWLSHLEARTYRLPTVDEWEFACRAGTTTTRYFSPQDPTDFCWWSPNSDRRVQRAGHKRPNAFGLFDMLGNAGEIGVERHGAEVIIQIRGGHYNCDGFGLRAAYREYSTNPTGRWMLTGFRVVCELNGGLAPTARGNP